MAIDFNEEKVDDTEKEIEIETEDETETETETVTESISSSSSKTSDVGFKRRLIVIMLGIIGVFLLILLILWILSLFRGRSYSYERVEDIMKNAAVEYFKDNKNKLPSGDNQVVEITASALAKRGYMKELSKYVKDDSCSGKVSVEKFDDNYQYVPYLDCGDQYSSVELYKTLTSDVVSTGDGLYNVSDGYIFRGEKVNNYLQLDKAMWRIVRITSDNKIMLVSNSSYFKSNSWDDRFNIDRKYNAGINDYRASRIREYLQDVYSDENEDYALLSAKDKSRLTTFDLCIGKRSLDSNINDNSLECSSKLENQKIGLLTMSDYLSASIDGNCTKPSDYSCQNYNYLAAKNFQWFLVTADSNSSDKVFSVRSRGVVHLDNASSYNAIRPVVVLNSSTMMKSGKGTLKNPYIVK